MSHEQHVVVNQQITATHLTTHIEQLHTIAYNCKTPCGISFVNVFSPPPTSTSKKSPKLPWLHVAPTMTELWCSWEIFADQLQLKPFERKRMERWYGWPWGGWDGEIVTTLCQSEWYRQYTMIYYYHSHSFNVSEVSPGPKVLTLTMKSDASAAEYCAARSGTLHQGWP